MTNSNPPSRRQDKGAFFDVVTKLEFEPTKNFFKLFSPQTSAALGVARAKNGELEKFREGRFGKIDAVALIGATSMTHYIATYEDAVKVENAAKAAGCGPDGSFLDYVEPTDFPVSCAFKTQAQAITHIKRAVKRGLTTFGCGEVTEIEDVPLADRCEYCICKGARPVRRFMVGAEGVDSEHAVNDCAN